MEPAVRVELTAGGLRNRCSTTELRWQRLLLLQLNILAIFIISPSQYC
jgi:hypothetical protein